MNTLPIKGLVLVFLLISVLMIPSIAFEGMRRFGRGLTNKHKNSFKVDNTEFVEEGQPEQLTDEVSGGFHPRISLRWP